MIPSKEEAQKLWETYHLPEPKRIHVSWVARVAVLLGSKISGVQIPLLEVAALLHDIDKAVPRLPGEVHPDTAVRILNKEGMGEVAAMVRTHSLHAILDPKIAPQTIEEKILYLADKMVKYEVITVDKRFSLWREEHLPQEAIDTLDACYPKVKALEKEIFAMAGLTAPQIAQLA